MGGPAATQRHTCTSAVLIGLCHVVWLIVLSYMLSDVEHRYQYQASIDRPSVSDFVWMGLGTRWGRFDRRRTYVTRAPICGYTGLALSSRSPRKVSGVAPFGADFVLKSNQWWSWLNSPTQNWLKNPPHSRTDVAEPPYVSTHAAKALLELFLISFLR